MSQLISEFANLENPQYIASDQYDKLQQLIQWVVEQSNANSLQLRTTELTMVYIYKYMSVYSISAKYLPLLGIVALQIACKFNECQMRVRVTIEDCLSICGEYVDISDVKQMEDTILELLNYNANLPTLSDDLSDEYRDIVLFVLVDIKFMRYPRAQLALAIQNYRQKDINLSEYANQLQNILQQSIQSALTESNHKRQQTPIRKAIQKHLSKKKLRQ